MASDQIVVVIDRPPPDQNWEAHIDGGGEAWESSDVHTLLAAVARDIGDGVVI